MSSSAVFFEFVLFIGMCIDFIALSGRRLSWQRRALRVQRQGVQATGVATESALLEEAAGVTRVTVKKLTPASTATKVSKFHFYQNCNFFQVKI